MDWRVDFLPCKAKIRRHPDGWQGFLTQSGRKIRRQDMRGEILNRLLTGRRVPCLVLRLLYKPDSDETVETHRGSAQNVPEAVTMYHRVRDLRKNAPLTQWQRSFVPLQRFTVPVWTISWGARTRGTLSEKMRTAGGCPFLFQRPASPFRRAAPGAADPAPHPLAPLLPLGSPRPKKLSST